LQTWQAVDTGSIHDSRGRGFLGLGRCRDLEALPIGWGAADASSRSGGGDEGARIPIHSAATTVNPDATALARLDQGSAGRVGAYRGLSTIHDLADRESPYPVTRVAVLARAERDPSVADRSAVRIFPTGQPDSASVPLQRMWALAAAEVYFRPPPPSERIEYASLYSPFWQVRLVEAAPVEREEAQRHVR
jgi:hypothetical protein